MPFNLSLGTLVPLLLLSVRPLLPAPASPTGVLPLLLLVPALLVSKLEDFELSELSALAVELVGRGAVELRSTCSRC